MRRGPGPQAKDGLAQSPTRALPSQGPEHPCRRQHKPFTITRDKALIRIEQLCQAPDGTNVCVLTYHDSTSPILVCEASVHNLIQDRAIPTAAASITGTIARQRHQQCVINLSMIQSRRAGWASEEEEVKRSMTDFGAQSPGSARNFTRAPASRHLHN